jgi:hypothetical protein
MISWCRRLIAGARSGLGKLTLVLYMAQLAACAGTVAPVGPPHRHETHAISDPKTTTLGKTFEAEAQKHPGLSGFDVISSGRTAFEARYVFAHFAQRTIDAQYFIWADDATGPRFERTPISKSGCSIPSNFVAATRSTYSSTSAGSIIACMTRPSSSTTPSR